MEQNSLACTILIFVWCMVPYSLNDYVPDVVINAPWEYEYNRLFWAFIVSCLRVHNQFEDTLCNPRKYWCVQRSTDFHLVWSVPEYRQINFYLLNKCFRFVLKPLICARYACCVFSSIVDDDIISFKLKKYVHKFRKQNYINRNPRMARSRS